jgi:hypothetical protein
VSDPPPSDGAAGAPPCPAPGTLYRSSLDPWRTHEEAIRLTRPRHPVSGAALRRAGRSGVTPHRLAPGFPARHREWAEVIHEWSARYGDKVSGWWFDGGYAHVRFDEEIAGLYADAVKRGNPAAIVTFNPGVKLVRHTRAEDYTAGELNEPFSVVPWSRWVEGSQWHALTYLGSGWGRRDTRYPTERWREWFRKVVAKGGVVTLDLGPNWDSKAGPIGTLAEAQVEQVRALSAE